MVRLLAIGAAGELAEPLQVDEVARAAIAANVAHYARVGWRAPWIAYLAIDDERGTVGSCAFKSAPRDGRVEIAYGTFSAHEGRGIATAMARALLAIAHAAAPDVLVVAQTLPEANASTAILTKLGFAQVAWAEDDEVGPVWEWHYTRT